jgi:hypothetical protein
MWAIGPLGFATPAVLWALGALPVLWWLLRALPPAPALRRFPGVALLLGLRERDPEAQRTPLWLMILRMTALAALILAFSGPVWNPQARMAGSGPLLIVVDAGWAAGRDWPGQMTRLETALTQARAAARPVAVVLRPGGDAPVFRNADHWLERLPGFAPQGYGAQGLTLEGLPADVDTLWLSDALDDPARAPLAQALAPRVQESALPIYLMSPPRLTDGALVVEVQRAEAGAAVTLEIVAMGRDPLGTERELARVPVDLARGALRAEARLALPPEMRNRVSRLQVAGQRGAGVVSLTDDSQRRRKVALLGVRTGTEAMALLSPLHYVRQALAPSADLIEAADLDALLLAAPDVIVLADVAGLSATETGALSDWVARGGLLLRFAGPRLAAAGQGGAIVAGAPDDLLPVALRAGGRAVGGAMSWGEPRRLAAFGADTPFAGLVVPDEVEIRAQVLAQPGPDLAARTLATLTDGTPLVTRLTIGEGQVVLFHVTANAEWSTLPLSGLFVQMLERLTIAARLDQPGAGDLDGTFWQADFVLDGLGVMRPVQGGPVPGEALALALRDGASAEVPPGTYRNGSERLAINVAGESTRIAAADWPAAAQIEGPDAPRAQALSGLLMALGVIALAVDIAATLALGGRLLHAALAVVLIVPQTARAQMDPVAATTALTLAYVASGEPRVDDISDAGLRGLGFELIRRTSVEPGPPMRVDPETDELALFPLLYWPVTETSALPSAQGYARLNRYLRSGGMILFDTRDAEVARLAGTTTARRRLQEIGAGLDIPPLEPLPADHVLTRTFYLLADFPGRHTGGEIWVEAAPPETQRAEGMPFRNLNDGVTPVVIGANDWAAAWAIDADGFPLVPIGRGAGGERQRELALRFGINLVVHVLSGNYKSDQVHVPALLERLGQ